MKKYLGWITQKHTEVQLPCNNLSLFAITTELIPPMVLNAKDPPEISGAAHIAMAI